MTSGAASDLLVIGGGLHGCAAAMFAAERGLRVTLLEKDSVGRHASGANAGGVRRLWRDLAEVPLANLSMQMWHRMSQIVQDDCGFQPVPGIKVAEGDADMEVLAARVTRMQEAGHTHERLIDRAELRALVPAVSEHCTGGLLSEDGFAMPAQTTAAFARRARALGVTILEGEAVAAIEHSRGLWRVETQSGRHTGAKLLNCAGAWGGRIAELLGETAPVEAIAPLIIVTQRMRPFCSAVIGVARRQLSFKQMANGTVVIGGARLGRVDPARNRTDIDFRELRLTARTAQDIFPIMRGATVQRAWSGIEGRTPDRLPIIGRSSRHESAFHAFGFSAHGFQLGPATGALMAELIDTGRLAPELDPFDITRFSAPTEAATQPRRLA
ncbi:FAD-dependent oxidoreductase [Salipiger sp. CCB-MM3]|uniref:NAD(P)/FAD-dependent oxidoreductase n=1 Tax=Salipiger sp. CCB-MM3 TaxID=1792508 RepID=UPI00080AA4F8|nr:FAD-binding oxidoreductase [Salipiger sp. CCB-MM3]ANT60856.1 FAD-dependent oxidoreductase [Salipiger sp. CCB-MM3]